MTSAGGEAVPGPVEVGLAAHRTLAADGRGRVVAVYRRAAYLRLPAGLLALVAPEVWRGPLHLRTSLRPALLAPGDAVEVIAGSVLRVGTSSVDLSAAVVWRGPLPEPFALAAAARTALADGVLAGAPPPALAEGAFADRLAGARHRLDQADLAGVARALGGLGPGLTPAGDDTLAGILLAARALGGPGVEAGLVDVAGGVRTTTVAAAFLEWAARGQCVEPVHDLLVALAEGDVTAAASHVAALARLGHTSGADLAYGLRLGLGLRTAAAATGPAVGPVVGSPEFREPDRSVARPLADLPPIARPCNAGASTRAHAPRTHVEAGGVPCR